MNTFPGSPKLLKGGVVLMDAASGAIQRIIPLQYNPQSLNRSLEVQSVSGEGANRSEALRLTGPPVETISLEAEIDAADLLEFPEQHAATVEFGIHPQLAALETMVYPASSQLEANRSRASQGMLEIAPMEAPLTVFVWSKARIAPVRITEFRVVEEFFDPRLNPIRAKVSLGMRVLSVTDLGFDHRGGSLFMAYHKQKERLAQLNRPGDLSALGVGGIS
jgi:hypothetical protein